MMLLFLTFKSWSEKPSIDAKFTDGNVGNGGNVAPQPITTTEIAVKARVLIEFFMQIPFY